MPDETALQAILQSVKSMDDRTARMEQKIDDGFEKLDGRVRSLETSRTAARAGLAALAVGGTGAGAKLGILDKVMSMFGGGGT